MNANRLLAHYEHIADAPDAIARLRRFILDLAVRGKLVPQDPNDEPAAQLVKRIAMAKARGNGRERNAPDIANAEGLSDLPASWCAVPLIALGSWAIGSGFPRNEQGLDEGPYFFLKVSDMNLPGNEKYITTSKNFIDDEAAGRMRAKIHLPGTIIFPKICGAIATNKRRILTRGSAIDNNCLGITFSNEVNNEWAYSVLTILDFTQYQAGTAVPALQQGVLERIPVGLPPLAEQHRIVAKVDELMALCDRLEAGRAEREATRDKLTAASYARVNAPDPDTFRDDARFALDALAALTARADQIKELRQTILNLAVRGKLVPQDPRDEQASELLKRIAVEKARLVKAGKIRKEKPLPAISEDELPFDLPRGWAWTRLGDLVHLVSGQHLQPPEYSKNPKGRLPYITGPSDFGPNGLQIDRFALVRKAVAKKGQLLLTVKGSGVGKTATCDIPEVAISRQLMALSAIAWDDRFLILITHRLAEKLQEEARSLIPGISREDVEEFVFPLPSLAEQRRIVAKVDELIGLCDQLEANLTTTDDTRRRLLEALLAEALAPDEERELEAAE